MRFHTCLMVAAGLSLAAWPGPATADQRGESPGDVLKPPALEAGDTIAIVVPAGPTSLSQMRRGKQYLEQMGFKVRLPEEADRKQGYLAGSDELRAKELMAAFRDPQVDAVFAARGGYGATRILDELDYQIIRQNPKILTGYSDITALHLAIHQQTGLVTFHSPNVEGGPASGNDWSPLSKRYFWRALLARHYDPAGYAFDLSRSRAQQHSGEDSAAAEKAPPLTALAPGVARGRLVGGNLSVLHALMGTPYEIDTADKILFLEDVGEAPYRVDRMLQTLKLAGKFDRVAGVLLGGFTRRSSEDTSGEVTTIDDVLKDFFGDRGAPVLKGFPVGHQRQNVTLPIGARVELDADQKVLRILESPVRGN